MRAHVARDTLDIAAIPRLLLRETGNPNAHIRDTNPGKRVPLNPGQIPRDRNVLSYHILEINVLDDGQSFGIVPFVRMFPVTARHPEHVFHGVHGHASHVDVFDVGTASGGGFDTDTGLAGDGGDVLGPDVFDAAGHLAAEGDDGAVGGDAGEAADDELLSWEADFDSVLVPPAFYGDAVVTGDYETVFNPGVCAGIC